MALRILLLVSLCSVINSERIFSRNCEYGGTCQVTSVDVENCSHAPRFCRVTPGKRYPMSVSFVPDFLAESMTLTTTLYDVHNENNYHVLQSSKRVCEDHKLVCPIEPRVHQNLNFDLEMNGDLNGSRLVVVNLSNPSNVTERCCFSFKVKAMRSDQH